MRLHLATVGNSLLGFRVLYLDVTSACKSPLNTGIQRIVRGIYRALRARTRVTPLLWSDGWGTYCRLGKRQHEYLTAPFRNYRSASDRPETLGAPSYLSKTLRHLSHRSLRFRLAGVATSNDILFVPDIFQDDRTKTLATVRRWFPGRRVAIFYDAIPLRLPEVTKALEQKTFPEYVRALANFDKVICISRETEADLKHYWNEFAVAGGETSVQLLPIDFSQPRTVMPPNDQAQRILCVSSFHLRKNHIRLFQAAELLWSEGLQFELILVGRTTAHGGPTVSGEIDRLTRKGRPLHWQRHVDDESLHEEYRRCSFTVYPSVREGFGLPLLESLWYCRPCLCGGNGALGEVADGGGCLLINQEDVASIANGMRQLLQDRETYHRLYEQARHRRFRSLDNYADELLAELQSKSRVDSPASPASGDSARRYFGGLKTTLIGALALVAVPIHETNGATPSATVAVEAGTLRTITLPDGNPIARA